MAIIALLPCSIIIILSQANLMSDIRVRSVGYQTFVVVFTLMLLLLCPREQSARTRNLFGLLTWESKLKLLCGRRTLNGNGSREGIRGHRVLFSSLPFLLSAFASICYS